MMYSLNVADITCESISLLVLNAQIKFSQGNEYGAMVMYSCRIGYQMSDATESGYVSTKTVFCNEDGKWGPQFATCLGE